MSKCLVELRKALPHTSSRYITIKRYGAR
jgi:hypothetical protein